MWPTTNGGAISRLLWKLSHAVVSDTDQIWSFIWSFCALLFRPVALAAAHNAAVQMIDTSIVRVHQHGACITRNQRQSMGRSRGGLTSKIHAVVDSNGLPVRLALSPGEAHDIRLAGKLLSRLRFGSMLLADWIRALAMKKGAWANIPPKSNRSDPICFSPYFYRARNQVERFFNRIKQCRRVATRYDRLAGNYLAFVQLASIRLRLAARYESTP